VGVFAVEELWGIIAFGSLARMRELLVEAMTQWRGTSGVHHHGLRDLDLDRSHAFLLAKSFTNNLPNLLPKLT
jgi:hypothetical protein